MRGKVEEEVLLCGVTRKKDGSYITVVAAVANLLYGNTACSTVAMR